MPDEPKPHAGPAERPDGDLYLGLDIGSVCARIALADGAGQVVHLDAERIYRGPAAAVAALLDRLSGGFSAARVAGAGVTGSGRHLYDRQAGWQVFSSPYAIIAGVLWDRPDARTIIAIGGQSAMVIALEEGLEKPWRVARSPLCAAGTGRFLEQQASRLGISIEEFGEKALEWKEAPPRIAARCSVFAKSDLIHLQQKGWPVPAMLAGLSDSVARMILAQWRDKFEPPVLCVGGVAGNRGVVRALSEVLGEGRVLVPSEHATREAIGAALLARGAQAHPAQLLPPQDGDERLFYVDRRLDAEASSNGWKPAALGTEAIDVGLGVDVGSTSTKAAVIGLDGGVLAKTYLMTAGRPLEAVKQVMDNLAPMVEGKVRVQAVGVTGSGRYLVGSFIGADLIKNEITAQTTAALHIDPQVDTIFEMGGQDSKYVYLENGTVLDYQMNKACAAGTGSFVDELAEQLGVSTRSGEFARLAFAAEGQLDLGEKCTAFMSQAVTSAQQAGASMECIVASLSASLAKNYRSKVVGNRRIGQRVYLTGAVFYNQAAVSAFKAELPGKTFVVPEHKEVTGAIGAALLALEAQGEAPSRFKGFGAVAAASYRLSNFTCPHCENSCAISMMATEDGQRLFYGSRCDRYDAAAGGRHGKVRTPFTEREELLFEGYRPNLLAPSPAGKGELTGPLGSPSPAGKGTGVGSEAPGSPNTAAADSRSPMSRRDASVVATVGIPRALMTFDIAPMMTAFLTSLGMPFRYSSPTNGRLIEKSLEHAYTDSCFPIKLLHGHVAELLEDGAPYILIPNAIRMAEKQGDEDQRYSCPLVQAAPYIVRSVFQLGDRLLDPVIDFSQGDAAVIKSLAETAVRLGKSRRQGTEAARQALAAQRRCEARMREAGQRILDDLAGDPQAIGVVLLSRAYNAQDAGANLGMAAELQKLGVVPIPMDFLPLETVDVRGMSDRPYWNYERKILAASRLIAEHPQLFGLFLSNFGCGPNSFIQNFVEDVMGGKPVGQIEVDEHAAEAGYITRLEALVDTIRGYRRAGLQPAGDPAHYARRVRTAVRSGQHVLVARMADHAEAVAAAMQAFGVDARVLPESDERSMALSRDATSGKECLPFRDTLGVLLRMAADGDIPPGARSLMAGSFGPCRLGKYAQEQQKILDDLGIDLEVMTTVSNNAYADLGLGPRFELLAWRGVCAIDYLQKLLWSSRPYQRRQGEADEAYAHFLGRLVEAVRARRPVEGAIREAAAAFAGMRDPALPHRPLVGINGEIYLRANRFCNKDLVRLCEAYGLEAEVAPMGEWIKYTSLRNLEDAWSNLEVGRTLKGAIRKLLLDREESSVSALCGPALHEREPSTRELLAASSAYLPARNGSEAVLSLGSGVRQMRDARFAGVISVMPHGCMPGGIVAAIAEQISKEYGHKPWISLTYDGFPDRVNPERVADLAELLRHQQQHGR